VYQVGYFQEFGVKKITLGERQKICIFYKISLLWWKQATLRNIFVGKTERK